MDKSSPGTNTRPELDTVESTAVTVELIEPMCSVVVVRPDGREIQLERPGTIAFRAEKEKSQVGDP